MCPACITGPPRSYQSYIDGMTVGLLPAHSMSVVLEREKRRLMSGYWLGLNDIRSWDDLRKQEMITGSTVQNKSQSRECPGVCWYVYLLVLAWPVGRQWKVCYWQEDVESRENPTKLKR